MRTKRLSHNIASKRLLTLAAAAALIFPTVVASPNTAFADTANPVLNSSTSAEAARIWEDMQARFTKPVVDRHGNEMTVKFSNKKTGEKYSYTYTYIPGAQESTSHGNASPLYIWTSSGWVLNRKDTAELIDEGINYAIMYGILAGLGLGSAGIGAAIEAGWSNYASKYYNRGNCIKIHYWMAVSEVKYGEKGCY